MTPERAHQIKTFADQFALKGGMLHECLAEIAKYETALKEMLTTTDFGIEEETRRRLMPDEYSLMDPRRILEIAEKALGRDID